jgi:hypothetical protein
MDSPEARRSHPTILVTPLLGNRSYRLEVVILAEVKDTQGYLAPEQSLDDDEVEHPGPDGRPAPPSLMGRTRRACAQERLSKEPGMSGCGSADPGRISEVSIERGTPARGGTSVPTARVVFRQDPFSRGLLRSVRGTDVERRYKRGVRAHPAPGVCSSRTHPHP